MPLVICKQRIERNDIPAAMRNGSFAGPWAIGLFMHLTIHARLLFRLQYEFIMDFTSIRNICCYTLIILVS